MLLTSGDLSYFFSVCLSVLFVCSFVWLRGRARARVCVCVCVRACLSFSLSLSLSFCVSARGLEGGVVSFSFASGFSG